MESTTERELNHLNKYIKGGSYRQVVDAIVACDIFAFDAEDAANQVALYLSVGIATGRSYVRSFPTAIESNDSFHRDSCNPTAFVQALRHAFASSGSDMGMQMLVSKRVQEQVCGMLFLSELGFNRMLTACLRYSEMTGVQRGTTAGTYGTIIKFAKAA